MRLTNTTMTKTALIYHDADLDGILSREVCLHFLKSSGEVIPIGWDYGRALPSFDWAAFDMIYIVDLSVDELMIRPELLMKIRWIDHHKSAIDKWGMYEFTGLWIDGVAACRLCWQYFTQDPANKPKLEHYKAGPIGGEPRLVYLAGIYDVWDKHNEDFEDGKTLQFGYRGLDQSTFELLVHEQFAISISGEHHLNEVLKSGDAIRSYCQKQNDEYSAAHSRTVKWEGLTFCALNIGQRGNSALLLGGIKPEHDACFAWRWTGDSVMVSLYHIAGKEHHDLSVIATKYGGGGHRGACGFRLSLHDLEQVLTCRDFVDRVRLEKIHLDPKWLG